MKPPSSVFLRYHLPTLSLLKDSDPSRFRSREFLPSWGSCRLASLSLLGAFGSTSQASCKEHATALHMTLAASFSPDGYPLVFVSLGAGTTWIHVVDTRCPSRQPSWTRLKMASSLPYVVRIWSVRSTPKPTSCPPHQPSLDAYSAPRSTLLCCLSVTEPLHS